MEYKTGTLVEFRSRPWVVQQSSDKDLLVIKPLGGTDTPVRDKILFIKSW